ncbi:anti-anti-sigma factor [Actinacidiphila alni]|uniref:Anti-anti-sigma factor n=1 Tax=Actinacidiphila alni TaxID=380248 RepID=A0A1I2LF33_9ACTN|nr:STAS domain-containing protein [Actinacidiphila alni]SFF77138.1 anti-anti-sigma factor [Actinacidiphila alni]
MPSRGSAPTPLPVVAARGELDAENLPSLEARIEAATADAPGVVLDISDVTFGDSSFINLLLRIHQATDLRVAGPQPQVERLFRLVGVDALLRIYPTAALAQAVPR